MTMQTTTTAATIPATIPATIAPAAILPAAHGAEYYKAERAKAKAAAVEQYVHGKSFVDLLKAPSVKYNTVDDDGKPYTDTAKINVFAQIADKSKAALVKAELATIHAHIKQAAYEMRRADDGAKVSRNAIVKSLQTIADGLRLNVTIKRNDVINLYEWMTAAKTNGDLTDTAIRKDVVRAVQRLLTNKVNAYEARIMCGKEAVSFTAPAKKETAPAKNK